MNLRMCERALPVTTKRSHVGEGVCVLVVMIIDLVAIGELCIQRRDTSIDFRANAFITHIGVDRHRQSPPALRR
jgi:hypothetical protein